MERSERKREINILYEIYILKREAMLSVYFHDESFCAELAELPLVESSGTRILNHVMYFLSETAPRNVTFRAKCVYTSNFRSCL